MHCYIVPNQEEYSWFSSLSMCVFYTLFLYSCKKLVNDYTNNINNNTDINNLITKISNFRLNSIKESHNDEYKQKMFQELLDINSLERSYILYFIFKRKGDFKSLTSIEYIDHKLSTILTTILTNKYTNTTEIVEDQDKEQEIENIIY